MKSLEAIKKGMTFQKIRVSAKDRENLEKNKHIQQWFANVPSPETKKSYATNMIRFLRETHLTVDELFELRKQTDEKEAYHPVEFLINFWKVEAKKHGRKIYYRNKIITALESFFVWNMLRLEKIKKDAYSPEEKEEIRKEDLKLFRDALGNIRNTALFDFLTSVPLRIGMFRPCHCGDCDVHWYPRWGHILSFPQIKYGSVVKIPAKKGHTSSSYLEQGQRLYYIGFINESAKNTLTSYKNHVEKIIGRKLTKEDAIFLSWREHNKHKEREHVGREPVKEGEINRIFRHASEISGKKFTVHDLRNFITSTLERHGVPERFIEILKAHKVSNLKKAYSTHGIKSMWKGTQDAIGLEKGLPYIDVGNSQMKITMAHDERILKLEEERDKLTKEISEMKIKQDALKKALKAKKSEDYPIVEAFLGLMQKNPKRLEAILQDMKAESGIKELAEKKEKESKRD